MYALVSLPRALDLRLAHHKSRAYLFGSPNGPLTSPPSTSEEVVEVSEVSVLYYTRYRLAKMVEPNLNLACQMP